MVAFLAIVGGVVVVNVVLVCVLSTIGAILGRDRRGSG